MQILPEPIEFEWDEGNIDKNKVKHGISNQEAEDVLMIDRFLILKDESHSAIEDRYVVIGPTREEKILSLIITVRSRKIRIISARMASRKEKIFYEKTFKDSEV